MRLRPLLGLSLDSPVQRCQTRIHSVGHGVRAAGRLFGEVALECETQYATRVVRAS
jgi:hypothetical protein